MDAATSDEESLGEGATQASPSLAATDEDDVESLGEAATQSTSPPADDTVAEGPSQGGWSINALLQPGGPARQSQLFDV
jgi:hypothetical protein